MARNKDLLSGARKRNIAHKSRIQILCKRVEYSSLVMIPLDRVFRRCERFRPQGLLTSMVLCGT